MSSWRTGALTADGADDAKVVKVAVEAGAATERGGLSRVRGEFCWMGMAPGVLNSPSR